MILEIVGFHEVTICRTPLCRLILPVARDGRELSEPVKALRNLLTLTYPDGLSHEELTVCLRRQLGPAAPQASEIAVLVRSSDGIEDLGGYYRARADFLQKPQDHFERILRQAREPLHIQEIARRAQRATRSGMYLAPSVSNIVSKDKRFRPIGRSGFWALAEWPGLEMRSVADLAAELLKEAGRPISHHDLCLLIRERRRVLRRSVFALLRRDARFTKAANNMWHLRHPDISTSLDTE